jgi:hypothetical protein
MDDDDEMDMIIERSCEEDTLNALNDEYEDISFTTHNEEEEEDEEEEVPKLPPGYVDYRLPANHYVPPALTQDEQCLLKRSVHLLSRKGDYISILTYSSLRGSCTLNIDYNFISTPQRCLSLFHDVKSRSIHVDSVAASSIIL